MFHEPMIHLWVNPLDDKFFSIEHWFSPKKILHDGIVFNNFDEHGNCLFMKFFFTILVANCDVYEIDFSSIIQCYFQI
jgi:hypothetical protein